MNRPVNLVLHCGAAHVQREQVLASKTPVGTDTHFPIPHKSLIGLVERKLPDYGLEIIGQEHAMMRDETRYFGLYQVQATDGSIISQEHSLVLGIRNSHDKSAPAGLCLGNQVFVCDNLAFSAEIKIARRHTRRIMDDLPMLIAKALGKLAESRVKQELRIEAYKQCGLTNEQAAHLIFLAGEAKALMPTQLVKVWDEWKNPSHEEFAVDNNLWRLQNAITEKSKGINPFELQARTSKMYGLFDTVAEFSVNKIVTTDENGDEIIDAEFTVQGQDQLRLPAPQ